MKSTGLLTASVCMITVSNSEAQTNYKAELQSLAGNEFTAISEFEYRPNVISSTPSPTSLHDTYTGNGPPLAGSSYGSAAAPVSGPGYNVFIPDENPSSKSTLYDASYSCVFKNLWSSDRHPNDFPKNPDNVRWTKPVIVSHSSDYDLWGPGLYATTGIQMLAEGGSSDFLLLEILYSGEALGDLRFGNDAMNTNSEDEQVLPKITLSAEHPLLSFLITMKPSPDWFSGFYDFDARDERTNTWLNKFTIETYPWDAGTKYGNSYENIIQDFQLDGSNPNDYDGFDNPPTFVQTITMEQHQQQLNQQYYGQGNGQGAQDRNIENPLHQKIFQYTKYTVPQTSKVFLNSDGTTVLPVGRVECTLD